MISIKKILIISEQFVFGGLETHISGQVFVLRRLNVECYLASWKVSDFARSIFKENIFLLPGPIHPYCVESVCVATQSIIDYVKANEIDAIHSHPFLSELPAALAANELGIPFFHTLHGPVSLGEAYGNVYNWYRRFVVFPFCSKVFSVSEEVKAKFLEFHNVSSICVQPNSVFIPIEEAVVRDDPFERWAIVARLDEDKIVGVEKFLRMALNVGIRSIEVIGDGSKRLYLQRVFQRETEVGLIKWVGMVSNPSEIYRRDFSGVAGMGRALLEAAAFGMPVCLVGYEGVIGMLDDVKFVRASYSNFSGRGFDCISDDKFKESLDYLLCQGMHFSARSYIKENYNEETIWESYLEEIAACEKMIEIKPLLTFIKTFPPSEMIFESFFIADKISSVLVSQTGSYVSMLSLMNVKYDESLKKKENANVVNALSEIQKVVLQISESVERNIFLQHEVIEDQKKALKEKDLTILQQRELINKNQLKIDKYKKMHKDLGFKIYREIKKTLGLWKY